MQTSSSARLNLRANGKGIVRLVNASDSMMKFAFKSTSKLLNICPRKGNIAPRSYVNIAFEDLKSATELYQVNLIYWVPSSSKANKSLIRIDMIGGVVRQVEQGTTWVIVSIIRSSFLILLVVYNIFLIKHSVL